MRRAYEFASEVHREHVRLSGEPYIVHPLSVAFIIADLKMDEATIAAALLHDVLEDGPVTEKELEERFGPEITSLVKGVTKLNIDFAPGLSSEERMVENYRRLFMAVAADVRVIVLKLADRLHNMRTLKYQYREKKEEIARETLEIFAPVAHRLGMNTIQVELENLSLFFLDPEAYCAIQRGLEKLKKEREAFIEEAKAILSAQLEKVSIKAEIQSRFKHIYSIYQKLNRLKVALEDLHDLVAMRVITDTKEHCYMVLGIVHSLWNPVEGRIKDYIALPKSNNYQSLHTTVIGPRGAPMEVQIRTWEMHQVAEYGIAAHWRYKEGKLVPESAFDERINWLKQLLEWQQDLGSTKEFMESLKISLFDDEVYVFTPKGDLKKLPKGATPIDFAYLIHTEVGNSCVGARVNRQMVPLSYELQSGDIVEIITSRSASGPSIDWLKLAKTPGARNKIRAFLRKKNQDANREKGRVVLEKYPLTPEERALFSANLDRFMKEHHLEGLEELHVALGEGRYSARKVVNQLIPYTIRKKWLERHKSAPSRVRREEESVLIQGTPGIEARLSRCCTPVPGDPIVAFVTQGRGITVHRVDCANVKRLSNGGRLIEAEWKPDLTLRYSAGVVVEALDRPRLLADVTNAVSACQIEIKAAKARTVGNEAYIYLLLEVGKREELDWLFREIHRVPNVKSVRRGGAFYLK
ncbi:MAG: RelA/SpoT family protein [Candidatus Caldatribacteriaceae bacterium]